ncbi:MAG: hypothetical protein QHI48_11325 [Bacteroidota bacterium]|nr:hypothetical protein [Bacteroidota bacterium]
MAVPRVRNAAGIRCATGGDGAVVTVLRNAPRPLPLFVAVVSAVCAWHAVHVSGPTNEVPARRGTDRPGDADRFFYEQRAFPDGTVPREWRERAAAHIGLMESDGFAKGGEAWRWVSLGPANIAGRIRALAADPTDFRILYAGAAGGGIWKSTDFGSTWKALDDFLPNLRIGSIAVHPVRPATVFAGNGEGFVTWQNALAFGRGIYRSDDAGSSWRLIPSTANDDFAFVFDIAFDPFDVSTVLACTRAGVMRSTDGGETWSRLRLAFAQARGMMAVFSRTTPGLVYAALEGTGVYRSTDHGTVWQGPLPVGLGAGDFTRVQIAAAPANGDVLYAAFTAPDEHCAGLFRSTNRGADWERAATPTNEIDGTDYMRRQGRYNSVLAVHPNDPDIVVAGGIDLYRSTNGGREWKQMTNWYPFGGYPYVHADQHAFLFDPSNPARVVAACDGGIFRSTDGGTTFADANAGLVTVQFHSGAPHPSSDVVLGGTIDNGNLRVRSGSSWVGVTGGDGGAAEIDFTDPRVMYAEIYYLDFFKSTDGGAPGTFRPAMEGIPRNPDGGTSDRCGFIAPFVMDPENTSVLYAGTYRVYRTTDGAGHWEPVSGDIAAGGYLTALAAAPLRRGVLYAGSSTGAVFVTTDGGGSWSDVSAGLPHRFVTDIAVDPRDPAVAYVTVSGFGTGHVWKTSDFGAVWVDISGKPPASLPDVPANTIALHPRRGERLFAGTDAGVFISPDGGGTWEPMNEGMGNVTVADLRFRQDGTLFAATHGRGMFKTAASLFDGDETTARRGMRLLGLYPLPLHASWNRNLVVHFLADERDVFTLEIFDAAGHAVRRLDLGTRDAGEYRAAVQVSDLPAGVYFLVLSSTSAREKPLKFVLFR